MSSPESLERAREWLRADHSARIDDSTLSEPDRRARHVMRLAALLDSVRAEGFAAGARAQREADARHGGFIHDTETLPLVEPGQDATP